MKINWSLILKIILVLLILLVLEFGCARAALDEQVSGEEYLAGIGADNQTRAELNALWKGWEA